jgi:hypothetical protein
MISAPFCIQGVNAFTGRGWYYNVTAIPLNQFLLQKASADYFPQVRVGLVLKPVQKEAFYSSKS